MKLVGSFEFDLTSGNFLIFCYTLHSVVGRMRESFYISLFFSLGFFLFHQPKVQLDCCHLSTDSFRAYLPLRHLKRSRAHHLTHKLDLQRRGTLVLIAPPFLKVQLSNTKDASLFPFSTWLFFPVLSL